MLRALQYSMPSGKMAFDSLVAENVMAVEAVEVRELHFGKKCESIERTL